MMFDGLLLQIAWMQRPRAPEALLEQTSGLAPL